MRMIASMMPTIAAKTRRTKQASMHRTDTKPVQSNLRSLSMSCCMLRSSCLTGSFIVVLSSSLERMIQVHDLVHLLIDNDIETQLHLD